MNSNERAALVEELAAALYQHDSDKHGIVRLAWDVPVGPHTDALKDDFRETAQGLMPIITRLLADSAPVPAVDDAERVEAAAKAMHERHWTDGWDNESEDTKIYYREDARAALAAAGAAQRRPPMTTNEATPREAIAKAIHAYTEVEPFRREWDSLHWADSNTYQGQADAVIAHLWRMADDPEVVEAVARRLYEDTLRSSEFLVLPDGMTAWDRLPVQIQNEWKAMTRSARDAMLTAMIGPRPVGSFHPSDVGQAVELYRAVANQESEDTVTDADRAALAAAGDATVGLDIDAMLNSVHPEATVGVRYIVPALISDEPSHWAAQVRVPIKGHSGHRVYDGTGTTRTQAVADAVAKAVAAKEAE